MTFEIAYEGIKPTSHKSHAVPYIVKHLLKILCFEIKHSHQNDILEMLVPRGNLAAARIIWGF